MWGAGTALGRLPGRSHAAHGSQPLPEVLNRRQIRTAASPTSSNSAWPPKPQVDVSEGVPAFPSLGRRLPQLQNSQSAPTLSRAGTASASRTGTASASRAGTAKSNRAGTAGISRVGTATLSRGANGCLTIGESFENTGTLPFPLLQRDAASLSPIGAPRPSNSPKKRQQLSISLDDEIGEEENPPASRRRTAVPAAPKTKNISVWHRWQVSVPSSRLERDATLERDRQRQKAASSKGAYRHHASPARSHAAAHFFTNFREDLPFSDFLPPGAFRRVARPQTNNMEVMPHSPSKTGFATSLAALTAMSAMSDSPAAEKNKGPPEELPLTAEGDVFEPEEVFRVQEVIDCFAALTDPGKENLYQTDAGKVDGDADCERPGLQPFVLRSTFCRFLLASKLCGSEGSLHPYHETIAFFDKRAKRLGPFYGMPRNMTLQVLATMIHFKHIRPAEEEEKRKAAAALAKQDRRTLRTNPNPANFFPPDTFERPKFIRDFMNSSLVSASAHCSARKLWLDIAAKETAELPEQQVPEVILEQVGGQASKLWPPLPPRSVTERDLPDWLFGVERWREELNARTPAQLLALRSHTENVLHGEILTGQLLEPEVLHFATRFRPLFAKIFGSYADFPLPEELQKGAKEQKPLLSTSRPPSASRPRSASRPLSPSRPTSASRPMSASRPPSSCRTRRTPMGHMSFNAFFRFCVDFGLFPRHACFSEIKKIYSDAEAVIDVPKDEPEEAEEVPVLETVPEPKRTGKPGSASKAESSVESRKAQKPSTASSGGRNAKPSSASTSETAPAPRKGTKPGSASDQVGEPRRLSKPGTAQEDPQQRNAADSSRESATPLRGQRSSARAVAAAPASTAKAEEITPTVPRLTKAQLRAQAQIRKAQRAAAESAAAAAAAVEAAVPKANLTRLEKPLEDMSDFEVQMLAFYAAVQEWLLEQSVRFADIWAEDAVTVLPLLDLDYGSGSRRASSAGQGAGGLGADQAAKSQPGSKRPSVVLARSADIGPNARATTAGSQSSTALAIAAAVAEIRAAAAPRIIMVNAAKLLKALEPMAMDNRPTVQEVEQMIQAVVEFEPPTEEGAEMGNLNSSPQVVMRQRSGSNFSEETATTVDVAHADKRPTEIAVYQLDKVLQKAHQRFVQMRIESTVLFRTGAAQSIDRLCCKVFEAVVEHMVQTAHMGFEKQDVFESREEVTAQFFFEKALESGLDPETKLHHKDLAEFFVSCGGSNAGVLDKHKAYRLLALTDEARRLKRRADRQTQLNYLVGESYDPPKTRVFGLGAFVECLLKLALHRLGGKGANEIQRGAPSWWKCAWLLTLIGAEYKDTCGLRNHERRIKAFATGRSLSQRSTMSGSSVRHTAVHGSFNGSSRNSVPARGVVLPTYSSEEYKETVDKLENWWKRIFTAPIPRYIAPMDELVDKEPLLFDPIHAESGTPANLRSLQFWSQCTQCKERRSPSGWGSPGCVACGGIDELCLPIGDHLFAPLLKSEPPPMPDNWKVVEEEATFSSEEEDDDYDDFYGDGYYNY